MKHFENWIDIFFVNDKFLKNIKMMLSETICYILYELKKLCI